MGLGLFCKTPEMSKLLCAIKGVQGSGIGVWGRGVDKLGFGVTRFLIAHFSPRSRSHGFGFLGGSGPIEGLPP